MKAHVTFRCWAMLGCLLLPFFANAQQTQLRSVSQTWALTNVHITTSPGEEAIFGTILISDGLIKEVGAKVKIPGNATIIEGDSAYLYAGFISGCSHIAVPSPENERNAEPVSNPGNPAPARAGIQPQVMVSEVLDPQDKDMASARKAGFTMAQTMPLGSMMPGQGAIILLRGDSQEEMVYRDANAMFAQWRGASGVYPSNLLGVIATWKDLFGKASYSLQHQRSYQESPSGKQRPVVTPEVEALFPVVDGDQPVMFETSSLLSARRAMTLAEALGFKLMLAELQQGWSLTNQLVESDIPVFLSYDLPEMEKPELDPDTIENAFEKEQAILAWRKYEEGIAYAEEAATLAEAGVRFGFSTTGEKPAKIFDNLAIMMEHGLSTEDALAALTTNPADILGLSDVTGTISSGKMANLVMLTAPFGTEDAKVKMTVVEGESFEFDVKEKKKSSSEERVDIAGTWSYTVKSPQGSNGGTLLFKGEDGEYTGTIENPRMGQTVDLEDIEVDGNIVTWTYTVEGGGRSFTIDTEIEIDGDTFEGTISLGDFGSFDIEGEREPEE